MGRKKGGGARTPYEAANTLNSAQDLRIIDAICEGEIAGFAHGDDAPFKSIYFDDTPVQNPDNSFNFKGVTGFFQTGAPDQSYIPNFDATERTVLVSAPVKRNAPVIRAISDNTINRLRVTVGVERNVQVQENGDTVAATTELVVELVNNSGVQAARNVVFNEKGSSAFYHDVIFDTLPAAPFNLRVRRVTADSTSDKTANNTFFASYVEIIDAKLSYPHTALAALKIDSDQFGNNVPRRNYLIKGKIVQVPSNYDPETREYSGSLWDGSFKMAWTNNPAWVFYDLLTNARYSTLAHRLHTNDIDKWALYQIAKYCDELVPDGFGGQEPRFVCNAYITDQRQAGELLNDLASVFCGLPVWNGNQISVLQDKHTDPVAAYGNANVVNGRFDYASASLKSIHTAVHVQYADKHDGYRAKVEYVANNQAVERYGLNIKRVTAFGCDSRGQAVRFGNWILETELRQQHTITFSVGREGLKHLPYDVVSIADNDYAGAQIGGRVVAVSGSQITLDRDVNNAVGAMLFYTDAVSGSLKSVKITRQINGKTVETESAINAPAESAWAMSGRVKPRLYRAMSVKENTNDGTYTITALRHDPEKYGAVDTSAIFDNVVNTLHNTVPELNNAAVSAENGGLRLAWDNLATDGEVLDYDIKVYQNNVLYRHFPNNPTAEISLDNLPDGDYRAEIRGRNARGVYSPVLIKTWQINYTINGLRANAKTFAIELVWTLPEILAVAANTEIWYGTTGNIQAARKLATLPTPQNGYTMTGVAVTDRFYFWARLVDVNGRAGTFTTPILGQADSNPAPIVAQIQGAITESALSRDLLAQFAANDTAAENRAKADTAAKITAEASARAAAIRAETQARQAEIRQTAQTAQSNLNAKAAELTAQAATLGNRVAAVENVNAQQAQAIQTVTAAQSNTAAALEAEKVARATALQAETAARETLAAKLSDLSVGGRNYLWNTLDFSKNWLVYKKNNAVGTQSIAQGFYECDHLVGGDWTEIAQDRVITLEKIPVGSKLMLSFEAKTNTAGGLRFGLREYYTSAKTWTYVSEKSVNLTVSDDWVRYTVELPPMKTNSDAENPMRYIRFLMTNWLARQYAVRKLKLEIGNVATDWTPAPEDIGSDIQAAIETERAARTTALQAEAAARETLAARFTISDTRNDNQPPTWYWANHPKQTVREFKSLRAIGLSQSGFGMLQTEVSWENASGGKIEQKLTDSTGKVWRRLSDTVHTYANRVYTYTKDTWTEWAADETALGAQEKADAVRAIAEAAQRSANAAQADLTAERTARTTADNAQTQQIQAAQSRLNAAESNIVNLQRTTSEQNRALSEMQTTLTAKIDGLSVGGRNLLKNSARRHEGAQYSTRYELTEAPAVGDDVAVTVWGDLGSDRTGIGAYNSHGFGEVVRLQKIADGIYRGVGKWKKPMRGGAEITPNDTHLNVYFYPNSATSINIINKIKLEKGNIGTDWSPAPEDTQTAAEAVQAELTAYKSAQATAEAAQTAEIQAAKAQIGQAQTTLEQMRSTKADKTEVLGLVQTTLQSSWRSDVAAAENRAKAEATRLNSATDAKITALQQTVSSQNSATATRLDTLSASINNINVNVGGRNLLLKSDVGRTTLGTSRYDITPNFDLSTIDELVLSVDIDVANFKRNVTTTYSRIGAEIQVFYDDEPNTQNFVWFRAWFMGSDTAQTSKQRLVAKFKVPDGKRVAKLSYNKVQIHNAVFDHAVVKNIKLEIGNVATAWTPAPEDVQPATEAAIGALQQTIASQNTALASRVDTVTAKMDNLAVGGRNLLLGSDRGLRSRNTGTNMWQPNVSYVKFDVAASVTWHTVRHFTLSCYTEFNNIRGNAGSEFTRLGFEALVHFTDGGSQWISNFIQAPNTQAFSGRPSFTFNTPNGKTIARLEHTQLCLQGLSSGADMVVWRPKIEIGSVATDWTPAPEDMEQKVQAMYSLKVEAVGNRKAVAGLALGADGQTGDSQMLVIADKFALVQPHTQNIQAPFVVATVNGQTKMALAGDFVADGTILGRNIAAHQTLQAPNIHGGSLNIGGGRFTVNHDGHVSIRADPHRNVGTQINNNGVYIYDEHGVQQVAIGLL